MDGVDITKAVLNKGKQMASSVAASATNGNGGKKRRKGTDLKPIVTNEAATLGVDPATTTTTTTSTTTEGYGFYPFFLFLDSFSLLARVFFAPFLPPFSFFWFSPPHPDSF